MLANIQKQLPIVQTLVNNTQIRLICGIKGMIFMNKNDRRVIKTRESIKKAFNELILKKDLETITITEIAECANINRKTFYLHYESVEDVFKEFKDELTSKVLNLIEEDKFVDIESFFIGLNNIMLENMDLYKMIAKRASNSFFLTDCKNILKNSIKESFYSKSNMSIEVFNVYSEYIASGIINIYVDWLNSDSKLTLEELTEIAKDVVVCGWEKIIK